MNEPIKHYFNRVEKEVDRMRLLVGMHAMEYGCLVAFLRELGRPEDVSHGTYASVGFQYGQLNGLIVQYHLQEQESFVAAEPVLSWFLDRGWKQGTQHEDASWGYRQVEFTKVEPEPAMFWPPHKEWKPYELTATVRIWPHPNSQVCKKVEDGTEPKYKFVCVGS